MKKSLRIIENLKNIIEEYQCPGCVCGCDISCYKKGYDDDSIECSKHVGRIFLGMPIGFNRLGMCKETKIHIFEKPSWEYGMFNIPVWKFLDKNGNTLLRGLCPRTNYPWIHILIGNHLDKIDCLEITQKDIDGMD
jgi:hypothetical protein